jgi:hypothetical protein
MPSPCLINRLSYAARWKRLGFTLESLLTEVESFTVHPSTGPDFVDLTVDTLTSAYPNGVALKGTPLLQTQIKYRVYASQHVVVKVHVENLYRRQETEPLALPRYVPPSRARSSVCRLV